jgi:hypothetical protein
VISKSHKLAWLISGFEGEEKSGNEFKRGDYLKFGRVSFLVKETSAEPILPSHEFPDKSYEKTSEGAIIGNQSLIKSIQKLSISPTPAQINSFDMYQVNRLLQSASVPAPPLFKSKKGSVCIPKIKIPLQANIR